MLKSEKYFMLNSYEKMTLGLMRAISEIGVPCHEKVSVLGFDDFEWAANFCPRLTRIAQPTREIGRQAMKMLLSKLNPSADQSETPPDPLVVLKADLRIRESTVPPPKR